MTPETFDYLTVLIGLALLASQWRLHRDMGELRERMAKMEGLVEGFTRQGLSNDQ